MTTWIEDRLQILNLIASYSHAADGVDPEAYANCFTDDGTFIGRVGMPDERAVSGREALVAFAANAISRRGDRQNRHIQTNTMIVSQSDTEAFARTYLLVMTSEGEKAPVPGLTSVYEDELVKTPKGWRIRVRRTLPDRKGVLRRPAAKDPQS
ncbi:MAG: nuclear transport factor 2 family protein [Caulobacteraceae bacterium]